MRIGIALSWCSSTGAGSLADTDDALDRAANTARDQATHQVSRLDAELAARSRAGRAARAET